MGNKSELAHSGAVLWQRLFNLDIDCCKNRAMDGYTFHCMVETDGESCTLFFSKNKRKRKNFFILYYIILYYIIYYLYLLLLLLPLLSLYIYICSTLSLSLHLSLILLGDHNRTKKESSHSPPGEAKESTESISLKYNNDNNNDGIMEVMASIPYVTELSAAKKATVAHRKLVAIDPNVGDLLYASDNVTAAANTFRYSYNERQKVSGSRQRRKKLRRAKNECLLNNEISVAEVSFNYF